MLGAELPSVHPHARRLSLHHGPVRQDQSAAALGLGHDPDWLFEQNRRIAQSLAAGEIVLAQIYGLRIPLGALDGAALRRLAALSLIIKAGFDPNEPRIPKGEPGAGQRT